MSHNRSVASGGRREFRADAATAVNADRTLMDDGLFAALVASLGVPDESPELARLAALPKLIQR